MKKILILLLIVTISNIYCDKHQGGCDSGQYKGCGWCYDTSRECFEQCERFSAISSGGFRAVSDCPSATPISGRPCQSGEYKCPGNNLCWKFADDCQWQCGRGCSQVR